VGDGPSVMAQEIREQPLAVERTLAACAAPVAALATALRTASLTTVVLVARGSSDHAAIYARYLLEARCGLLASLAAPSLFTTYRAPVDLSRALVLGVSQSGEVPEIVESLRYARERGALTAALTNDPGSALAAVADHALVTAAGVERALAATKTFTTQLAVIALLARALAAPGLDRGLELLPAALAETTAQLGLVEAVARRLAAAEAALCVARGFAYPAALEAALKLKETTGLWAEGFSSADLVHGPTAAATGLPALVLHGGGPFEPDLEAIASTLAERGGDVVAVGAGRELPTAAGLPEELMSILLVVPVQELAERLARLRGRDPDAPPGLTKITRT
jgi:glucosamine--fructose-6-phosphate aminotransferase (isomerizing)